MILLLAALVLNVVAVGSSVCISVSLFDTFGDGWGHDVGLRVTTASVTQDLALLCEEALGPIQVCSEDAGASFDVGLVSFGPYSSPTDKMFYTVQHGDDVIAGNVHTLVSISPSGVDIRNPISLSDVSKCYECTNILNPTEPTAAPTQGYLRRRDRPRRRPDAKKEPSVAPTDVIRPINRRRKGSRSDNEEASSPGPDRHLRSEIAQDIKSVMDYKSFKTASHLARSVTIESLQTAMHRRSLQTGQVLFTPSEVFDTSAYTVSDVTLGTLYTNAKVSQVDPVIAQEATADQRFTKTSSNDFFINIYMGGVNYVGNIQRRITTGNTVEALVFFEDLNGDGTVNQGGEGGKCIVIVKEGYLSSFTTGNSVQTNSANINELVLAMNELLLADGGNQYVTSGSPTSIPSGSPAGVPSEYPTSVPSENPTGAPSGSPTNFVTALPTGLPSSAPSGPSSSPTSDPSARPSVYASEEPTGVPSAYPTAVPSQKPISIYGGSISPTSSPITVEQFAAESIAMIDSLTYGWCNVNKTASFVQVADSQVQVKITKKQLVPIKFTFPEYIISSLDRSTVISRGGMCESMQKAVRYEGLSDGRYVFRVTGALSRVHTPKVTKWEFCGQHGDSMDELEFSIGNGKCKPAIKTSQKAMCHKPPIAVFLGDMLIYGARREDLTEDDFDAIEAGLKDVFEKILASWNTEIMSSELLSGSRLWVQYRIELDPSSLGFSAYHHVEMDTIAETMSDYLDKHEDKLNAVMYSSLMHEISRKTKRESKDENALTRPSSVKLGTKVSFDEAKVRHSPSIINEVVKPSKKAHKQTSKKHRK